MANGADLRTRTSEELAAVAGDAGIMVRVIGYIGKITNALPVFRWHLVAGKTLAAMLFGGV